MASFCKHDNEQCGHVTCNT